MPLIGDNPLMGAVVFTRPDGQHLAVIAFGRRKNRRPVRPCAAGRQGRGRPDGQRLQRDAGGLSASGQQSQVAEEMNRAVVSIRDVTESTVQQTINSATTSDELAALAGELSKAIGQLKL